jgi:nitrilase
MTLAQKIKVAVVQIAPHPNNALRMAQSVADQVYEVAKQGARLIVFPEALIGEDQKGDPFDCQITQRNIEVRETYAKYYVSAIYLDGPEIACISKAAANTGAFVVIGIILPDGPTVVTSLPSSTTKLLASINEWTTNADAVLR